MNLIAWGVANNVVDWAPKIRQGAQALVVFARKQGADTDTVLVVSKGLTKLVNAGDPVTTLANAEVYEGKNAAGEPRLYIGREDDGERVTMATMAATKLPF